MPTTTFPLLTVLSVITGETLTTNDMASADQLVEHMIGRPLTPAIKDDAYAKCRERLLNNYPELDPARITVALTKLKLTLQGGPEYVDDWIAEFCKARDYDKELEITFLPADAVIGEWEIMFAAIVDMRKQDKETPWGAAVIRGLWNLHDTDGDDFSVGTARAFLCQMEKALPHLSRQLLTDPEAPKLLGKLRTCLHDGQKELSAVVTTIENWEKQSDETATAKIAAELVTQLVIFASYVRSHCLPYDVKDPNKGLLFYT